MLICFIIFAAGGIGSLCRYIMSFLIGSYVKTSFPLGTLCVNIAGSFAMGISFALFEHFMVSPEFKLALTVGFLGGFTTFSTYTLESANLLKYREYRLFVYNLLISNILGLFFVIIGMNVIKLIF